MASPSDRRLFESALAGQYNTRVDRLEMADPILGAAIEERWAMLNEAYARIGDGSLTGDLAAQFAAVPYAAP